ncbi:hypothetical protein EWM64_g954 [Hericium alpestre]|uniref:SGNH hydrolase-type esterase domain-containing protein n=1 Tax=Hericium alpestre TaxID=135208 RepID=A0A4Z0ABS2_9AGAM|nr:hypothetical protein EWM64_g954 [Hericium alpestre]
MSIVYRVGPYWRGYGGIKSIIVFGDSYSHVGYHSQAPPPTSARPLGVASPGLTVNEPGYPNWVGHLITAHTHGQSNILVYDYAVRGDTAPGVSRQITEQFLPTVGRRPRYTQSRGEIAGILATLFAAQEQLYGAGARNFLFVDVPPIHRSPIGTQPGLTDYFTPFAIWNEELRRAVAAFAASHADVTAMVYSSWATFSRVLDNPAAYGFNPQDVRVQGGSIWFDHIHPTTRLASIVADEIAHFLAAQAPTA